MRLVSTGPTVELDFVNEDVEDIVAFMAELGRINALLPSRVRGKITIVAREPLPRDLAWQVLMHSLAAAGWTLGRHGEVHRLVKLKGSEEQPDEEGRQAALFRWLGLPAPSVDE